MSIFYAGSPPMSKSKIGLLVIDAHAQAYRAYFALHRQNLTDALTGQPTGGLYGFFRMLFKILLDTRPDMTAVVWDAPGRTFRDDLFDRYKATRSPMPDDLRSQIERIKILVAQCGFMNLEQSGYEADDLIGTLAARFGNARDVLLLSGDKDCYQLLNKRVSMMRGTKGVTEFVMIDPDWVLREVGVSCRQIPDYMGLVGDSSDNIPGAKGIGPKTAVELLQKFGSLEALYERVDEVAQKGTRAKLVASREEAFLSRKLAVIDVGVPLILDLPEERLRTPDFTAEETALLFRERGFNQIYQELKRARDRLPGPEAAPGPAGSVGEGAVPPVPVSNGTYELVSTEGQLKALVKRLEQAPRIAVDTETDSPEPMRARLLGVALSDSAGKGAYVSIPPEGSPFSEAGIPLERARPLLQRLLCGVLPEKVGQNVKYDLLVLRRHGIELGGVAFDTMVASYLCNPGVRRHNLDDMAHDHLGLSTIRYDDVVGTGRSRLTLAEIAPEQVRDYAGEDADLTLRLSYELSPKISASRLDGVLTEIELPLIPVLASMEEAGVAVDVPYFQSMGAEYARAITGLESRIHHLAKRSFNIGSTKELQQILFQELKLPHGKKTKTGHSTDQSVLEGLRGAHPIVDTLLEHRKYVKLKNTYIDVLPGLVNAESGRIHTSFNQTIAATGRLSSNEPNLQNIPVREAEGRAIRRGFIAGAGRELLSLDYSQIELRVMAHYSNDEGLVSAFAEDMDVHARTASSLFGVFEQMVTPDMRSKAKVVNFSIIYGVTEFGLARGLGLSRSEARGYIDRFFERYPGVRRYMDATILSAREKGQVETLSGRIRQIPDIGSPNRFKREGAERTAVNTPIQGTSADIIKLAMIRIAEDFRRSGLASRMILQVHDELLFDVVPEERDVVLEIARSRMESAMELRVPLKVDFGFGANWDEAH